MIIPVSDSLKPFLGRDWDYSGNKKQTITYWEQRQSQHHPGTAGRLGLGMRLNRKKQQKSRKVKIEAQATKKNNAAKAIKPARAILFKTQKSKENLPLGAISALKYGTLRTCENQIKRYNGQDD